MADRDEAGPLLASLQKGYIEATAAVEKLAARLGEADAAIARVRELHKREVHKSGTAYCYECCDGVIYPWPCLTIRALDEEADRV